MRTLDEINDRIRGLLFEELQRRVAYAEKRLPCRCVYNKQNPLDSRHYHEGEDNSNHNRITTEPWVATTRTIGLCMYGAENPEEWPGNLCEDAIDAQRCPLFKPRQSKEEIWEEFANQLHDCDWIQANMPRVYELLWVSDAVTIFHDPWHPWWVRLWWYFLRINLEPLRPGVDLTHYLPPAGGGSDGVHGP
jgi:hypothetical protein